MIRAILLDVDGTLLDSNDAHAHAWVDALKAHGYSADFAQIRRLIGMGGDKLLPQVAGIEEDSAEGKPIVETRKRILKETYIPHLRPTPGARALLQRIQQDGLQLVVATSSNPQDLEDLLKAAQVDDLIQEAASSGDADNSKPDPDIVHAALEKAGCDPEETIMLGDTPYDVEAAGKAGVPIIAVRSGGWNDADLAGAVAVYDDPADLLAHYDDSPLGKRTTLSA